MTFAALQAVGFLIGLVLLARYSQRKTSDSLPPGPKPLPLVGNIMDLPSGGAPAYLHWLKFNDAYGPISSITVLGHPMIILHGKVAANEILEKIFSKTSARPTANFANLCGFDAFLPFRQCSETFKLHRKLIHQQLGTLEKVSCFNDTQDVESRRFLLHVLNNPEDLIELFKQYVYAFHS
jgi:fumagillin biosynthesis cytochrome P450 monooxygenase